MLNVAQPAQKYFLNEAYVNGLQIGMISLSVISFFSTWMIWFYCGDNLRFPITIVIFFFMKLVADVSLTLEMPTNIVMSKSINLQNRNLWSNLFLSNTDPFVGLALITFSFAFSIERKSLKITQALMGIITLIFVMFVEIIFQLSFSFSIYSALMIFLFAYVLSYDVDRFYSKWNEIPIENTHQPIKKTLENSEKTILSEVSLGRIQVEEMTERRTSMDSVNSNDQH